jgi:hypothetical protein
VLELQYLYSDVDAHRTGTDSQRHTGSLSYMLSLSSVREVGLTASHSKIDFDPPFAPDLDVTQVAATFNQLGSTVDTSFTGGYSWTQRDLDREDVRGALADLTLTWRPNSIAVVEFNAGHRITDRSTNLLGGLPRRAVEEDTDLNEVFKETVASIVLTRPIGNNEVALSIRASREDYEDVPRDSERASIGLVLTREVSPRTTFRGAFDIGRRDFSSDGIERDEYRGGLSVEHRFTPRLAFTVAARYEEWDQDTAGRNFSEWLGSASIRYTLLERR